MSSDLARKYLMRMLQVKRTRVKAIEERASAGVCILDHCGCEAHSRGLCQSHYNVFDYELRKLSSEEKRLEFEEANIVEGNILARGDQRKYTRKTPFVKVS